MLLIGPTVRSDLTDQRFQTIRSSQRFQTVPTSPIDPSHLERQGYQGYQESLAVPKFLTIRSIQRFLTVRSAPRFPTSQRFRFVPMSLTTR